MNKAVIDPSPTDWNGPIMQKRIASRYAAERRFKAMGFIAVALSTLFLAFLLFTMLGQGLRLCRWGTQRNSPTAKQHRQGKRAATAKVHGRGADITA